MFAQVLLSALRNSPGHAPLLTERINGCTLHAQRNGWMVLDHKQNAVIVNGRRLFPLELARVVAESMPTKELTG